MEGEGAEQRRVSHIKIMSSMRCSAPVARASCSLRTRAVPAAKPVAAVSVRKQTVRMTKVSAAAKVRDFRIAIPSRGGRPPPPLPRQPPGRPCRWCAAGAVDPEAHSMPARKPNGRGQRCAHSAPGWPTAWAAHDAGEPHVRRIPWAQTRRGARGPRSLGWQLPGCGTRCQPHLRRTRIDMPLVLWTCSPCVGTMPPSGHSTSCSSSREGEGRVSHAVYALSIGEPVVGVA
jgi:hypothetical protein